MDQHVISEWLLRAFARRERGGPELEVYDKSSGLYGTVDPARFMTEADAHSTAIERGIAEIVTPASRAALRLAKRVKALPPGVYAVVSSDSPAHAAGPPLSDIGILEGMRLLVSQHTVPSPSASDRSWLGRYAGLMYQRAPKVESAILRFGTVYDLAAQKALDRILPGMRTGLSTELARRRTRMLSMATDIGGRLAEANWWIVRAGYGEAFVLGDSPVAATISLGQDDAWRAIFSPEAFVVVMPLGPSLSLLIAPQMLVPITSIDMDLAGVTRAINRLIWRHADRYVLARHRSQLEAAWPGADKERRLSVSADLDVEHVAAAALRDVMSSAAKVLTLRARRDWQHWTSCRLEFGWQPWGAEDRYLFSSSRERGGGTDGVNCSPVRAGPRCTSANSTSAP